MNLSRKQVLAKQLLSELEDELCRTEEKAKRLRGQVESARALASTMNVEEGTPYAKPDPTEVFLRVKNTRELVLRFLRDRCPGATIPELYDQIVKSGSAVGRREYLYTVIKKLVREGLVRKDPKPHGEAEQYYAVGPETNSVLHMQREGKTSVKLNSD